MTHKHARYALLGRGIQMLTQFVMVLVIPKVLLPEVYVQFGLIMPIALLGSTVIFGWLISAAYRHAHDLFQDEARFRRMVFAYFVFVGAPLLVASFIVMVTTDSIYALVPALALSTGLKSGIVRILNAAERHKNYFLSNVAFAISLGIFILVCAANEDIDLKMALSIYFIMDFIIAIVAWKLASVFTFKPAPYFDARIARRYFKYGLPVVLNSVAVWMISLSDRYLLAIWVATEDVASYILSYQLAGSIIIVPMTFAMAVIFPRVIGIDREAGEGAALEYTHKMLRIYIRYAAIIFIVGCAIVVPFKFYVYPSYQFNPEIMIIIVLAHVIFNLSYFYNKEFELNGKTFVITRGVGLGALVNIGLNIILIPVIGALGAAVSTLAAYMVAVFFVRRAGKFRPKSV